MLGAVLLCLAAAQPQGGSIAGTWKPPTGEPGAVSLSYHREQEGAGRISVVLPTGEVFVGEYLRLSGDLKSARIDRIFARWQSEGFDQFEVGPAGQPWDRRHSAVVTFRRKHLDRVVATLISETRKTMRCSFALVSPKLGLPGGASGRCQLTDGATIDV